MEDRQCKTCDEVKPAANYDGKNKRFKSYHVCRGCINAKLIRCKSCDTVKEHTEYREDNTSRAYLSRKSTCTECLKETDKDYNSIADNKDRHKSYYKDYYRDNRERILARDKAYKLRKLSQASE